MPSPFPGMDPYLEVSPTWADFHYKLNGAIQDELNERLPRRYAARVDRYIWIHEPDAKTRMVGKPDVYVADTGEQAGGASQVATLAAPATVILPAVRREGNRYIKIIDLHEHRVVTVVEVLSPANKNPGEDRDAFLAKRNEYLANRINLVEIDLLRSGARMPWGEPPPRVTDYYVLVSRASDFPRAGIWPLSVRDPLPTIPVPLKPTDADTLLPLQKCVNYAYDHGRYELEIDYAAPPEPPLGEADAAWARDLARKAPAHS